MHKQVARRSNQRDRMLALFGDGSRLVSNAQFAEISLKYSARITEMRAAGIRIEKESEMADGLVWYRLNPEAPAETYATVLVHVAGVPKPIHARVKISGASSESHARSLARAAAVRVEIVGNAFKPAQDIQNPEPETAVAIPAPQLNLFDHQAAA